MSKELHQVGTKLLRKRRVFGIARKPHWHEAEQSYASVLRRLEQRRSSEHQTLSIHRGYAAQMHEALALAESARQEHQISAQSHLKAARLFAEEHKSREDMCQCGGDVSLRCADATSCFVNAARAYRRLGDVEMSAAIYLELASMLRRFGWRAEALEFCVKGAQMIGAQRRHVAEVHAVRFAVDVAAELRDVASVDALLKACGSAAALVGDDVLSMHCFAARLLVFVHLRHFAHVDAMRAQVDDGGAALLDLADDLSHACRHRLASRQALIDRLRRNAFSFSFVLDWLADKHVWDERDFVLSGFQSERTDEETDVVQSEQSDGQTNNVQSEQTQS
jgi:hypothetical protein